MHSRTLVALPISLLIFYMLHLFSPLIGAILLLVLFLGDIWATRIIFIVIKELEKQLELDIRVFASPFLIIFGWLMYAVVQLMAVFYVFEHLSFFGLSLKWVFPLVAFKSIWLMYNLGRKPLELPLLSDYLKKVRLALVVQLFFTGAALLAFYCETFANKEVILSLWNFTAMGLLMVLAVSACLIPYYLFSRFFNRWSNGPART